MTHPELVHALLDPKTYPEDERPDQVQLTETHISWLFMTGKFVYKVKKPVDYGFLDFTTQEKRHFYCQEEVRLNKRLSPDVYLDVIEIKEEQGHFSLGEQGNTVDYAVKMRQLQNEYWLSTWLKKGHATPDLMKRIAYRIAQFHSKAETNDEIKKYGSVGTLRLNTEENFLQTQQFICETIPQEMFDVIHAYTEAFLETYRHHFKKRQKGGHIRDCHGDLHKDQICVENGISFIDCIEFNKRFRYCDVAADLAFLAMDLDNSNRTDLSRMLVESYIEWSGDEELIPLLNFYKCYRAYTRGKVISFLLNVPGLSHQQRHTTTLKASHYISLAQDYAKIKRPFLIITTGLIGTGKTTLSKTLSKQLEAQLLSSDTIRKQLAGIPPKEHRYYNWRDGIYSPDITDHTYAKLHTQALHALRAGDIVILDASYIENKRRHQAKQIAEESGAPFLFLETACPTHLLKKRLAARQESGTGISDGTYTILKQQQSQFEPIDIKLKEHRIPIDSIPPQQEVAYTALKDIYRYHLSV